MSAFFPVCDVVECSLLLITSRNRGAARHGRAKLFGVKRTPKLHGGEVALAPRDKAIAEGMLHRLAMRVDVDVGSHAAQPKIDHVIAQLHAASAIYCGLLTRRQTASP